MLATLIGEPFDDSAWLFETKWDGVRALCGIEGGKVRLTSRNGKDLLVHFPELAELARSFSGTPALLDGEIVTFDSDGRSSFQRLQSRINLVHPVPSRNLVPVTYVVFDALYARGRDLRAKSVDERKRVLEAIVRPRDRAARYSTHVIGRGCKAFELVVKRGLEGIIGKRRASVYQERRSQDWVKIKALFEQEAVIGGWTDPRGSRTDFGSLLVGVYEEGKFVFVGRVGTGFDRPLLEAIKKRLHPLETQRPPFAGEFPRDAHWVRPRLVCEVKFSEWTRDGIMRQPVFLGLRTDKAAAEVVRERPRRHRPKPKPS